MKTYISLDGLTKLAEAHPELDFIRVEPEPTKYRVVVSRNGELSSGECDDREAQYKAARDRGVWMNHRDHMMKATAMRRAIESAFPEFVGRK